MTAQDSRPPAGSAIHTPSANKNDGVLRANNVSYAIRGIPLLNSVDFVVAAGSVTAIIGPNGAGKSTLLAVLAGDLKPDTGSVEINGAPLDSFTANELARQRSVLLQQSAVAFSYTVREIVAMGRSAWSSRDAADLDDSIVERALFQTDTTHLAHRDVTTLSGGEQARAALARVIAQSSPIVLLDEPTAALDIAHQESVLELAGSLAHAGGAVTIVLHDLDAAATHADHVVVMRGGAVVAAGPPAEVMTSEILSEVYAHPIHVVTHPVTGRPVVIPSRKRFGSQ